MRDKQDVLAMCALQFAAQVEQKQITTSQTSETALARLQNLDKKLSELLAK